MNFISDPYLVLNLPLYQLDGPSFMSKDAYGHLCTVTGALWKPNGRYFDGTDDRIQVAYNPVFDVSNQFSVCFWVQADSLVGSSNFPVSRWKQRIKTKPNACCCQGKMSGLTVNQFCQ